MINLHSHLRNGRERRDNAMKTIVPKMNCLCHEKEK